eukprot:GHRQ01023649.1.p1 GENE.GHRQ01023649.1~~GHRQ01023649.1.p1  ORF type:complete len:199 (+),score=17.65 GHRQ01023649.1:677-1273(+)
MLVRAVRRMVLQAVVLYTCKYCRPRCKPAVHATALTMCWCCARISTSAPFGSLSLLCCPAALLVVADSHVRELFRRQCYTNFTVLIGRSMCVSDEHYLPSLMASYGLEAATDCKVTSTPGVLWHMHHLCYQPARLFCQTRKHQLFFFAQLLQSTAEACVSMHAWWLAANHAASMQPPGACCCALRIRWVFYVERTSST